MKSILVRSAGTCILAMLSAMVLAQVGIRLFGEEPMPSAIWLSMLLPLIIGFPISTYIFTRNQEYSALNLKLQRAYDDLSKLHQQLAESSCRDGMTGVYNREAFLQQVNFLQQGGSDGALLLIDADHFKSINDRYGHAAGDEALIAIARSISQAVRHQDIVGRLGGEEFGVYLLGADEAETKFVSERIRVAVENIVFEPMRNKHHRLSVSIGGIKPAKNMAVQRLMKIADTLLYRAKMQGRNRVILNTA